MSIQRDKGNSCEEKVCRFLIEKGYKILSRNFRCKNGEIDIIATDGTCLAVTEVKSFPKNWPQEDIALKVPFEKQRRIRATLSVFLETELHIKYDYIRFDVASVCNDCISYYEGAF